LFQPLAINTGANAQIWVIDQEPDRSVTVEPYGRRWRPGDPAPVRVLWDYHTGVEACLRNPTRYRAERMSDAEHAELVKAFKEAKS
jgi:hypothetical protein